MVLLIEKLGLMIHWGMFGAFLLLSAVFLWKCFLHRLKRRGCLEFLYLFQTAALGLSVIMFLIGISSMFRGMKSEEIIQSFSMWGHGIAGLQSGKILKIIIPILWLSGSMHHIIRKWDWKKKTERLYDFNEVVTDPITRDVFAAAARKNGLRREPMLFQNQAVSVPFLKGIIHPAVIIPEKNFSSGEKTLIFAHELRHLKAGDLLVRYFLELVFLIYWFVPFEEYWLEELIEIQESLCDIFVCRSFGETFSAEHYFSMILSISSGADKKQKVSRKTFVNSQLMKDIGHLEKRIVNMFGHQTHKRNWFFHTSSCICLGVILAMLLCPSMLDYSELFHRGGKMADVVTEKADAFCGKTKSSSLEEAQYLLNWNDAAEYCLEPGEMIASDSFIGKKEKNLIICASGEHKEYSICLEYNNEIVEIEAENEETSLNLEMEESEYVLSLVNTGEENLKLLLYCSY